MFQQIILVGNLGRDPEMRELSDGQKVTNMSVATNRRYTDSNGAKRDETAWFRVAVWGGQAEPCFQHLKKGRQVHIVGRLVHSSDGNPNLYANSEGMARTSFEVTASQVTFLGSGNGNGSSSVDIPMEDATQAELPTTKTSKKKATKTTEVA